MKTQIILCYDKGESGNPLVSIKIPTNCPVCDVNIKVINRTDRVTTFAGDDWSECCHARFGHYPNVWNSQIKGYPDGLNCRKCQDHFPWAEPNQNDGTLICFSCRSMGRR